MQLLIYECPDAPPEHRFVARFLLARNSMLAAFHHGAERAAVEQRAQAWFDAEMAKHPKTGPRKQPASGTDASAADENIMRTSVDSPPQIGREPTDDEDLIG